MTIFRKKFGLLVVAVGLMSVACSSEETSQKLEGMFNIDLLVKATSAEDTISSYPLAPALHFKKGASELIYIASYHDKQTREKVQDVFREQDIDCVVLEGIQPEYMKNFDLLERDAESARINGADSEIKVAIREARLKNVKVIPGEISDKEIYSQMLELGYTLDDIFGHYILRMPQQWMREGKIEGQRDPKLVGLINEFASTLLDECEPDICEDNVSVTSANSFFKWFEENERCRFATCYRMSLTAPAQDKESLFSQIAADVIYSRDIGILDILGRSVSDCSRPVAIYGMGHYLLQKKALEDALGQATELTGKIEKL